MIMRILHTFGGVFLQYNRLNRSTKVTMFINNEILSINKVILSVNEVTKIVIR